MADIYYRNSSSNLASSIPRAARRRRMEIRRSKLVPNTAIMSPSSSDSDQTNHSDLKRQRMDDQDIVTAAASISTTTEEMENGVVESKEDMVSEVGKLRIYEEVMLGVKSVERFNVVVPRFGVSSVRRWRRNMEDAVAIHPWFCKRNSDVHGGDDCGGSAAAELHYYAVYDGHGCSHVAERCRERLHHLVSEELTMGENASSEWRGAMERSFDRMDKEVTTYNEDASGDCRCELRSPHRDAVGSTAVVAVVSPKKIVVANCGDSRVVLSRDGKAVPLSSDHKPDRPIELNQIQEAGGQVTYLDQPRVLDVLAMSRAIGDNYLKPYVSSEPEVTVTERVAGDECLILASDGLWDVVTNDIACNVARTCLSSNAPLPSSVPLQSGESSDKGCSDASMLLTKLALARHTADNLSIVVVDLRKCT